MIYTGNRFTMYKLVLVRGARWKGYATIRVVVRTNDLSLSLSVSLSAPVRLHRDFFCARMSVKSRVAVSFSLNSYTN